MTAGSLIGGVLLAAWSQITSPWQLYAVQIGIGAASAASLYEAAFAVVIAWHTPASRSKALLTLTVVAGFASTIFMPLTGWLVAEHGWRTALLVLALIQAALAVPLHALAIRPTPHPHSGEAPSSALADPPIPLKRVLADRAFWLLGLTFTAHTAAISVLTVHLVAALIAWGHSPAFAATASGLFGVLSVTGRVAVTSLQRRYPLAHVVAAIVTVQAAAAVMLVLTGRAAIAATIGVVGFGLGFGVASIAKPVLLADRYDVRRFATIAGALVVPITIAKAIAPLSAAALHTLTGTYTPVFIGVAAVCMLAAAALTAFDKAPVIPTA